MNLTFPEAIYEDIGFKLKDYLLDNCRVYKWSLEKPLQHIDRYYFRETDLEIIRKISEEQDILKQTLMLRSAFK